MKRGTVSPKRKAALQKKLERLGIRFARMQRIIPPRRRQKESIVDVILASGREMDRIRRAAHLKAKRGHATDVLAFPESSTAFGMPKAVLDFPHPDREGIFLGDICLNEEIFMGDPDRGLALFIHGFLHLAGYGHTGKRDTIRMERLEKILTKATRD